MLMGGLGYNMSPEIIFQSTHSLILFRRSANKSGQIAHSQQRIALHQSACYLLATRVKKEQLFTARKQSSVNFNLLHNNYCAHACATQSHVWENPFCEVCTIWW